MSVFKLFDASVTLRDEEPPAVAGESLDPHERRPKAFYLNWQVEANVSSP